MLIVPAVGILPALLLVATATIARPVGIALRNHASDIAPAHACRSQTWVAGAGLSEAKEARGFGLRSNPDHPEDQAVDKELALRPGLELPAFVEEAGVDHSAGLFGRGSLGDVEHGPIGQVGYL